MDLNKKANRIEYEFSEDDAKGLYAVLSGQPQLVTQDQFQKGQVIYSWFFKHVQELATNFEVSTTVTTPKRKSKS